jgi:hypothetical protein
MNVKRILSAGLAALLLAAGTGALAAQFNFSGLELEELYQVREELDRAISALENRAEAAPCADGTYRVGVDLPEGDYVLREREDAMLASVVIRAGDSSDSPLLLHKLVNGQAVVHLVRDTWVTLSELRAWPMGSEPLTGREDGSVGEGAYLVGEQLPAGSYRATRDEKAPLSNYSVYSGILGTNAVLTRFEILREDGELTLEDGDYIELNGCVLSPIE